MKRLWALVCLVLMLGWHVVAVPISKGSKETSRRQVNQKQDYSKTERARFKAVQALLDKKGLPFDMQNLTAPDWRENLAQVFAQMPEMQRVRYEAGPLEGVVIADTLYLPEKIEIAGDTVILTKHLVFEGSNAVVRGNHNIYILPVTTIRVIGTTLANLNRSAKRERSSLPSWTDIQDPVKDQASASTSLTIDTSWYAKQPAAKTRKGLKPTSVQIMEDRSGGPGAPGAGGAQGADGWTGANAGPGYSGNCAGQLNGGPGGAGGNGTDGSTGGGGGIGGPGGTGGDIYIDLARGDTGTYVATTRGGPGGPGGPGGTGGTGGSGGTRATVVMAALVDQEDWAVSRVAANAQSVSLRVRSEAPMEVPDPLLVSDLRVIQGSGETREHPTTPNSPGWIWKEIVTVAAGAVVAAQTTGCAGMSTTANATSYLRRPDQRTLRLKTGIAIAGTCTPTVSTRVAGDWSSLRR